MKKNLVLFLLSFVLIGFISCCKCDEEIDVEEPNEIANKNGSMKMKGLPCNFQRSSWLLKLRTEILYEY